MSEQLQLRRGNAAQVAAFTGAEGEVVVDTTNNRLNVQDGATAGGFAAAKLSEVITTAGGEVAALGIGAALDPANPLSVAAGAALFNGAATGGDIRVKLNKGASTNTASLLYQDGLSGRAEIGLTGDDNFHFKVSPNGATWIDALAINATSGIVSASMGFAGPPDPSYLRGYLAGLTLSNNSNTAFNISDGVANADDNSLLMKTFGLAKTTGAWAAGNNNGGLDAGSVAASTWYHVYVIANVASGAVDFLFSLSATAPTLPGGYTKKRRIGSFKTDASSHIMAFSQNGDEFLWALAVHDIAAVNVTSTIVTQALASVPPGVKVAAKMRASATSTSTGSVLIYSPDESATAAPNTPVGNFSIPYASSASVPQTVTLDVRTNASQQIKLVANNGTAVTDAVTYGWVDTRGRFN
jgi:hypothetical protein